MEGIRSLKSCQAFVVPERGYFVGFNRGEDIANSYGPRACVIDAKSVCNNYTIICMIYLATAPTCLDKSADLSDAA